MKTLQKQSINTSGKVEVEWLRVKDVEVPAKIKEGWKYGKKIEWKIATKGYKGGKKDVKKAEVNVTEGLKKKYPRNSG